MIIELNAELKKKEKELVSVFLSLFLISIYFDVGLLEEQNKHS